jgi:hypothetical protein
MEITNSLMEIANSPMEIGNSCMEIPNYYREMLNYYGEITDFHREICPVKSDFVLKMSVLRKIDASLVVSGRKDCLPAANGTSARQPVGRPGPSCVAGHFLPAGPPGHDGGSV